MNIKVPVIGIPQYWWHKKAIKFSRKNPNMVKMSVKDLCYECYRHKELLKYFDNNNNYFEGTEYWKDHIGRKGRKATNEKINRYKKLYHKIKINNYESLENSSSIIIADDGCRLDGSHRLSILSHINVEKIMVNVFSYEKIFSSKESKEIRRINEEFRKKTYNL